MQRGVTGKSVFDRSGLARLSDVQNEEWRQSFQTLAQSQARFLQKEEAFRSADYKWPRDPLRTWSRVWEYPYVKFHLEAWRRSSMSVVGADPRVADIGSGVTFFPFYLAQNGMDIVCVDVDPTCERDIQRASYIVPTAPGRVSFRLTEAKQLPFDDEEIDALYCISVLEHVPDFPRLVSEMARILKPGGLCVLTVDLDLVGNGELSIEDRRRLIDSLERSFEYAAPQSSLHPRDILHSKAGPFPTAKPSFLWRARHHVKSAVAGLFTEKPLPGPYHLAVEGFSLRRRHKVIG